MNIGRTSYRVYSMIKDKSIFIKNIYWMLAYAFTVLQHREYEYVAKEEFVNIHNLFAAILAGGISRQLKQGLYREYVNHKENVLTIHGKIDMPGTMKNRIARKQHAACEFDELSENNLLNQIIKTTAFLLLRNENVKTQYKTELKKVMLFFTNVAEISPKAIRWNTIRFQRNNQSYRMLVSICQLVLEGMLMTTDKGEYKLASFLDDQEMSRLYEKFILEFYRKECPEIKASASQIDWALDDDGDSTYLPTMQSDIMLSKGNTVLIIDAKYYTRTMQSHYNVNKFHSGNLYQLFTYVKNKDKDTRFGNQPHTVSGMLLYAKTDETEQPNGKEYFMNNNMIIVRTLDLNREFSEIAEDLHEIANKYVLDR